MYHPESDCVRKPTILPCEPVSPPDCGGESVNPPCESVSSPESIHVRESTCLPRESVSPPEFPKELNRLATFYSALLYFLNSSLSEFLKWNIPSQNRSPLFEFSLALRTLCCWKRKKGKRKKEAEEKQKRKEEREQKRLAPEEAKYKKRLERECKQSEREERVRVRQGAGSSLKGMLLGRLRLWDDWCFTVCSQPQWCQSRLSSLEVRRQQWVELLWSPTLVRRLCITLLAQCAIEDVVIILFLV